MIGIALDGVVINTLLLICTYELIIENIPAVALSVRRWVGRMGMATE